MVSKLAFINWRKKCKPGYSEVEVAAQVAPGMTQPSNDWSGQKFVDGLLTRPASSSVDTDLEDRVVVVGLL